MTLPIKKIMSDSEAMIIDCLNRENKMTDAEKGFILYLSKNNMENMSQPIHDRLEQIWERIT